MILPVAKNAIDRRYTVGLFAVWALTALIQRPGWPRRMSRYLYLVPLWVAYASYQVVRVGTDLRVIGGYLLFLAAALVFDYYRDDSRTLVILTVAGILTFLGGTIASIQILLVNPMAARLASTGSIQYRDLATSGVVGDYRFTYAIALLSPLLVAISLDAGRTLRQRVTSLACACLFAYYLYLASFGISIGIMIVGTLGALIHHIRSRDLKLIASLSAIFAGLLFVSGFGAGLMLSVSRSIENRMLSIKAVQLAALLSGNVEESGRGDMYRTSINTFLEYPITGVGAYYTVDYSKVYDDTALNHGIGSHSDVFDTLARFGLVGTAIFLSIMFPLAFRAASEWKGTPYGGAASAMWILLFVFCCLDPVSRQTEIGVVVFLLWPALPHAFAPGRSARRRLSAGARWSSPPAKGFAR
jgi:O-Antigen ligase